MRTVCGKCSAEVELPKGGGSEIRCPSCGAVFVLPSLAEGEELPRPDTFPGYRIVALIGVGGMGAVYRAVQLSMDREVAIKVLLSKYAKVPRFVARFEREASALAALSHPHIVGVIDRGRVGDTCYFTMEYVHGRTLRYLVRSDLLSVAQAVEIAIHICQALEAAHAAGVIHRDIKPGNILIQEDTGVAKVADFGIAHMVEADDTVERERRSRLGTAKYMAPEQHGTGEGIDGRADVFGLGITLHEMLARELPTGAPPSSSNRLVPKELDAVVERATRPDRNERFQSASEMRLALESVREALRREETSATLVMASASVVEPATVTCPSCHELVPPGEMRCPTCGAPAREPCYRADCPGLNPLRAERCHQCGSHLKLLERQRRIELENLLRQAEAELAAGQLDAAGRHLQQVEADPHVAFEDLEERAESLMQHLLLLRPVSPWRRLLIAAAAVLVVGLALLVYWRVTRVADGTVDTGGKTVVKVATATRVATAVRVATRVRVQPQPPVMAAPSDAFDDYLLAVTDGAWAKRAPELRLAAACDAALCLAAGKGDGVTSKRLAKTLSELGQAEPPKADTLGGRLAATLDALCGMVFRDLARQSAAAPRVKALASRYAAAVGAASDPRQKLDLAASALYDVLASAEVQLNPKSDLPTRQILLDGALTPPTPQADLRQASSRILRAGQLLVRHLRREMEQPVFPELIHDARQKLAQAEQTQELVVRLAYGTEALVELLGAQPSLRARD